MENIGKERERETHSSVTFVEILKTDRGIRSPLLNSV